MSPRPELDSLTQLDGTALTALMESGELSAADLVDRELALIEGAAGREINAVVDLDADGARKAARDIDKRRRAGEPLGILAGLPVTIKDCFDAAGMRTSHGRLSDSRTATVDSPLVRRLREADAIILGKTNVPVYLADHQASNDAFGVTRNPFDPTRSPGGSSGGSGAAVAAGLSVADFGSDLAGSLRIPTAWCGLFGHRPSNGIVSKLGHMPWPNGGMLEPFVSVVGPMTRSAADADRFLTAIAGAEGMEAAAWRLELPQSRVASLGTLRVGLWLDDPAAMVDSATRSAIENFARTLESAGARVDQLASPPVSGRDALDLFVRLQAGEVVHGLDDEAWERSLRNAARSDDSPEVAAAKGHVQSHRTALRDLESQRTIAAQWAQVHDEFDVILCPAVPTTAPQLSTVPADLRTLDIDGVATAANDQVNAWSRISSLGRGPATVIPLGAGPDGMPIGAQLLGRYLDDRTTLTTAMLAEEAGLLRYTTPTGW